MAKSISSGLRSRTMSAALVTLGCSLGVTLTPAMLAADKPSAESKLEAHQLKDRAALEKAVSDSKATLQADQWKLTEFQKSLTPDALKLEGNQVKLRQLKTALEQDGIKLQATQQKLEAARAK